MDGYAFSFDDWDGKSSFHVAGKIQAGKYFSEIIKPLDAFRIFTGAPLPLGADTVVMQEKTRFHDNVIVIEDKQLIKGSNVRLEGSQTKEGDLVMNEGQQITPAAISFLASIGISNLPVYANLVVSIIVTGDELMPLGGTLAKGQIYESNSFGLIAALKQLNISPVSVDIVRDDELEITEIINTRHSSDLIILTGGVSVGEYDFVNSAMERCGIEKVFYKVKQKPGKPIYFGKKNGTLVLALPGNPAAVMTCFYEYAVPLIGKFTHKEYFKTVQLPLSDDFIKKAGLTFFLKGKILNQQVTILKNQESNMMNSFAIADCIIELEEQKECFVKGDLVSVLLIV